MTRARDLADLGSGITSGDLADDSITTAKVADANVTQAKLAGEAVNESKLQVSNAPVNGYMLTAQSGNTGGLTWAETSSGGYWNELSSVTLGGSVVSSIEVTMTTGYNVHRIDFRLPVPDGGSAKKNLFVMKSSGNTAQSFSFATASSYSDEEATQTVMEWNGYSGGVAGITNYWFGSIIIYDALSSSVNTRYQANLACSNGFANTRVAAFSSGFQDTAAATGKVQFAYSGGDFGTGSNLYYKLYGHTYT